MKITILCSSKWHPVYQWLENWRDQHKEHQVTLLNRIVDVEGGDILFLISCTELVKEDIRKKFKHTLVIHPSDLPKGRGWSPQVWQILKGEKDIVVTLFEAVDKVDAGDIWTKKSFHVEDHELYDEFNRKLFETELSLMDYAIENVNSIIPKPQILEEGSYFPRRNPEDSQLDPDKSISEQFDLIRIADPNRFPCYFYLRGKRYKITIQKY